MPRFISSDEYTISTDYGFVYIKDELTHDKKALEELRLLVCPSVPQRKAKLKILVTSAKSILDTTYKHLKNAYNSAVETLDVNEFFQNMAIVKQDFDKCLEIEKYVYYDAPPNTYVVSPYAFPERYQIEIRHLLDRVYKDTSQKDDSEKALSELYQNFKKHEKEMDDKSKQKFDSKFKKYLDQ